MPFNFNFFFRFVSVASTWLDFSLLPPRLRRALANLRRAAVPAALPRQRRRERERPRRGPAALRRLRALPGPSHPLGASMELQPSRGCWMEKGPPGPAVSPLRCGLRAGRGASAGKRFVTESQRFPGPAGRRSGSDRQQFPCGKQGGSLGRRSVTLFYAFSKCFLRLTIFCVCIFDVSLYFTLFSVYFRCFTLFSVYFWCFILFCNSLCFLYIFYISLYFLYFLYLYFLYFPVFPTFSIFIFFIFPIFSPFHYNFHISLYFLYFTVFASLLSDSFKPQHCVPSSPIISFNKSPHSNYFPVFQHL